MAEACLAGTVSTTGGIKQNETLAAFQLKIIEEIASHEQDAFIVVRRKNLNTEFQRRLDLQKKIELVGQGMLLELTASTSNVLCAE